MLCVRPGWAATPRAPKPPGRSTLRSLSEATNYDQPPSAYSAWGSFLWQRPSIIIAAKHRQAAGAIAEGLTPQTKKLGTGIVASRAEGPKPWQTSTIPCRDRQGHRTLMTSDGIFISMARPMVLTPGTKSGRWSSNTKSLHLILFMPRVVLHGGK